MRNVERTAVESYCAALQTAESYLVEVDPADAEQTRAAVREVCATVERSADSAALQDSSSRFRAVLRDYQQRAHEQIHRLRGDLESALVAMQGVADSLSARDSDHREKLSHELVRLRATSGLQDVTKIRAGILSTVQGIETCVNRMERENQLVIAQLCDEIRVLHERVESVSKQSSLDPITGLFNRHQTEVHIETVASHNSVQPVSLVYLAVRNYKLLCHQSGREVVEAAMAALGARARGIFGEDAHLGRWSDDELLVVLRGDPAHALSLSKKAATQTPGAYPVQVAGHLRQPSLKTQIMFLERRTGESAREILRRIDSFALGPQSVGVSTVNH